MFTLLATRRLAPLFAAQFLGAFNDNLYKVVILMAMMFGGVDAGIDPALLLPIGGGLIILPFFLFSASAGELADRLPKAAAVRWIKAAEIAVMLAGAAMIVSGQAWGMLAVLFAMGTQSALFGPLKYGILPELLEERELVAGNAAIEAGTFLAILLGTIAGGLLAAEASAWAAAMVVAVAAAGWLASLFIPATPAQSPAARLRFNPVTATREVIGLARRRRSVFLSILGLSYFWMIAGILVTEMPHLVKEVIGGGEGVVTAVMAVFSIGIGLGSFACERLLRGRVTAVYVPLASIAVALFALDLHFAAQGFTMAAEPLGVAGFLALPEAWRLVVDLLGLSVAGGLFAVPLYAFMQAHSDSHERARVIAANNILNAAFMVAGSLAVLALLSAGSGIDGVFLAVGLVAAVAAVYICGMLPRQLFRSLAAGLLRWLFRVEVVGAGNFDAAGPRAVIVANHVSWLDGALLAAFGPEDACFAIDTHIFRSWWGGLTRFFADMVPVDPTNPMSTKAMVRAVEEGRKLVIFPEGRITVTGALMMVHEGPGLIADKAGARLVPVRIDGAEFSKLSRLKGKLPLRWFPRITIRVLPPVALDIPAAVKGRERRRVAGEQLYDLMSGMMFSTSGTDCTLFRALLAARRRFGAGHPVVEDAESMARPMGYGRLTTGALALAGALERRVEGEAVGVLLPNAAGVVVTFFALQALGRVPAMLNFTAGADGMLAACEVAGLRSILTSRRFIERARLQDAAARLAEAAEVIYLEDLRRDIGPLAKLRALLRSWRGRPLVAQQPDDPAVILFTSGSEGRPKGVALSHRNLLSNLAQIGARVDFSPADRVFNALPVFHSFGLTGGTLLPLLNGIRTFLYPSPLHYRVVPALAYASNATVLFGTDTFLSGYARMAKPYSFFAMRYVFAGAERVRDETRRTWAEKFGLRILEGYGATECSPVIAVNSPMHYRAGTVGRLLPAIEAKLEPVPGVDHGARLAVRGPNVMLGYVHAEAGALRWTPVEDGWYDTGDIVDIDGDGFMRIVGRAKRFVKVGGEMVSLAAVEAAAAELWPDHLHAAVGLPDARKGEQIALLTDRPGADRAALLAHAQARGMPELMVPRLVLPVTAVPLLGTGKIDHPAAARLAREVAAARVG